MARRLEAIAVNLHVVSFLLGVVDEIGGSLPPMGKDVYCRRIRFFRRQGVGEVKSESGDETKVQKREPPPNWTAADITKYILRWAPYYQVNLAIFSLT